MNEPIIKLYLPQYDRYIEIFDNGKVKTIPNDLSVLITNHIFIKENEIWNEAIEAAANLLDTKIRKLKR